jgi:O-antigen ligase
MSGTISLGGIDSYAAAITSCIILLVYFLVSNLIRTEKWLRRCVFAFVGSGTVVAALGVIQYIMGFARDGWIDTTYFADIYGRATSVFENPNYLAAYLVAVLPFALYCAATRKATKERRLYVLSAIMILACIIFTWSRAAWLAAIICVVIFSMIYTRKTFRYIFAVLFTVPFMPFVLSKNVITRFVSIGDLADSSTLYRVYTWKGSLEIIKDYFWSGIGYGTSSFAEIYPVYAYAGIESAVHSHSLYLQILISMGIGGLICLLIIAFLYIQKSLEYINQPCTNESRLFAAASFVCILALLAMGLFDFIWYNYTIFFVFWMVAALGVACIRHGNREKARAHVDCDTQDFLASVDIDLHS